MGTWEERPLDPGWTMLPGGRGRTRPDGSTEWAEGQGPGGYEDITENQAKQTRNQLSQIDAQQANRWDKFGTSNRPPTPDEVAPRGTREWRDAFDKEQNWLTAMAQHGASPGDLGLEAKAGRGLANFSRWGEITDYAKQEAQKGNWIDPNKYGANPNLAYKRPVRVAQSEAVSSGGGATPDLWPGATGQEGSLPQYNAQMYQPQDSWGGWSGTYGNNPGSTSPIPMSSNPSGLTQPPIVPPASTTPLPVSSSPLVKPASSSVKSTPGYDYSGINPGARINNPVPMYSGGGGGASPITMGRGMVNHRRPSGFGGQVNSNSMLIRR